jgi:hypothetical protein
MTKDMQDNNFMAGRVETYVDRYGDLVLENPEFDTDWERLEGLPHDEALIELLEYQLANGYDVIRPEEIGALTDALIIGWDVLRDDQGKFKSAAAIYWHDNYQVQNAVKILQHGDRVIFKKGE